MSLTKFFSMTFRFSSSSRKNCVRNSSVLLNEIASGSILRYLKAFVNTSFFLSCMISMPNLSGFLQISVFFSNRKISTRGEQISAFHRMRNSVQFSQEKHRILHGSRQKVRGLRSSGIISK